MEKRARGQTEKQAKEEGRIKTDWRIDRKEDRVYKQKWRKTDRKERHRRGWVMKADRQTITVSVLKVIN